MTPDTTEVGLPLTFAGAAFWFARNLLEALIWAAVGAVVLVLVLVAQRYPMTIMGIVALLVIAGALAWSLVRARGSKTPTPQARLLQFEIFRVPIKLIIGVRRDPQGDRR